MKREDIIDSLEYIEDDFLEETDRARSVADPAGTSEKITPVPGRTTLIRRWTGLAAGFALLIVAAFVITGILRQRTENMGTMKTAEVAVPEVAEEMVTEAAGPEVAEEMVTEAAAPEAAEEMAREADEAAAETEYAAGGTEQAAGAAESSAGMAPAASEKSAEQVMNDLDVLEEIAPADADTAMRIRVTSEAGEVIFILNNTPAAKSLAAQLPLSVETEPYSDNEIVFHPEEPLDTANGLEGGGPAGYLGYFEPWNNVVMYYGDFEEYPGLYILGEAVSGEEIIKDISGTVTIETEESSR